MRPVEKLAELRKALAMANRGRELAEMRARIILKAILALRRQHKGL